MKETIYPAMKSSPTTLVLLSDSLVLLQSWHIEKIVQRTKLMSEGASIISYVNSQQTLDSFLNNTIKLLTD